MFNYNSYRQETNLKLDVERGPDSKKRDPSPVKICKFLEDTDILVSADLDGYIHFWCVTPGHHPKKNKWLLSIIDESEPDVGNVANFPVRAMDYDNEGMMLYAGDEMGYMNKWDISAVVHKLNELKPSDDEAVKDDKGAVIKKSSVSKKATFLTGYNE